MEELLHLVARQRMWPDVLLFSEETDHKGGGGAHINITAFKDSRAVPAER
jgi:hypothetical protein